MGKTFRKAKIPPGEFKVTTLKNSLINNQAVTKMRNLTTTLAYPKIQCTVEPSLQYPIGRDLVVAFFPLTPKSPTCDKLLCMDLG